MPATLIWNDSLTFQQPEPVDTTMTVTYALDVPSFTPVGIPFLCGSASFGPKWTIASTNNSGSQVVYWRSNATGERTGIGFTGGGNGTAVFYYYFPQGVFIEGVTSPDNIFLADGGSIEVDITYTTAEDFYLYTYEGIAHVPEWSEPAWEFQNMGMAAFVWDVVGMYTTTSNPIYQVVVEGIMQGIPNNGGFSSNLNAATWSPGQSPHENVTFEFPMWGFDPANDTAWTLATQSTQPQALAQNVGDSGTIDEGQTTFYSANMTTQYTTDSGVIGTLTGVPVTDLGQYEMQLPYNNGTDFQSVNSNYHSLNPKYYGMPIDIEAHVDFQSPYPVTRSLGIGHLTQPLNGSIGAQTVIDDYGFTIDPSSNPYSFDFKWNFLPSGIWIQLPAGTVTLLGKDAGGTVIYSGPDQPFDLQSGTGNDILFGEWADVWPTNVVSFAIKLVISRAQLASFLGINKNQLTTSIAITGLAALPASGDVTFNLVWYFGQTIFDPDTATFSSAFVPLGDPVVWSIPQSSHTNGGFQRVSFFSNQENFVPTPENPIFGPTIAYNVIVSQNVTDIPHPTVSYLLDLISASVMIYSGGQQTYTRFAANGGRMLFPAYYPPMNWQGVFASETAYFTRTIDTVVDDNTITLMDPAPTTVGNSWNYEPVTLTGVGISGSGLLLSPSVDIPPSATHVMVDLSCDLDPSTPVPGLAPGVARAAQVGVRAVGICADNSVAPIASGNYIVTVIQGPILGNPPVNEAFMFVDWGNASTNNQNAIYDMRWYTNSDSPLHRLVRFNTGFGGQATPNTQVNINVDNPSGVSVTFDVTFQFFRLEPTDTNTYGNVSVMAQDPPNAPTIQNATDSMPAWQDMVSIGVPDFNFIAAQYAGDQFLDTWNVFQNWPPLTDADYASEVAIDFGETPGLLVQTFSPDEPFYDAQTNFRSAIYSIIFRQFPQSSTCVELGTPLGCGFSTTQTMFNNFNPGPPNPITLDPSLVVSKAYAAKANTFVSSSTTAFLMTDGTVWCGGVGAPLYGVPSPWGTSGWDYVPRPLTVFQDPPVNLPPMVDIELCFLTGAGSNFDLLMLDGDGNLWAWGFNISGQFGLTTTSYPTVPVIIANNVTAFHGTGDAVMYVSNGLLYVAGSVQFGTLGLPIDFASQGVTSLHTFTQVPGLSNIRQITSWGNGGRGYAVLDNSGTVWGWVADNGQSFGGFGILGQSIYQTYNSTGQSFYGPNGFWVPCTDLGSGNIQIQGMVGPTLYTLTGDGNILVTGHFGGFGSSGDGDNSSGDTRSIPPKQVLMPIDSTTGLPVKAIALAIGQQPMSMVASDGNCYAWGTNATGALGIGTLDTKINSTPTLVVGVPLGTTGIFRGLTTTFFYQGVLPGPTVPTIAGGQVVG